LVELEALAVGVHSLLLPCNSRIVGNMPKRCGILYAAKNHRETAGCVKGAIKGSSAAPLLSGCDNTNGIRSMEQQKNLHASIPAALLTEAEQAASAVHVSVDEWVRDAMQRRLREERRQRIYAYGEQQAKKLGIKEEDVERIIHEFRQENQQSNERGR
jgi:hypothetical protein